MSQHVRIANPNDPAPNVPNFAMPGDLGSGSPSAGTFLRGDMSWGSATTFPLWWFGDGSDGALSLAVDTTLAADDNVKFYTNLSLNGHMLRNNSFNTSLVIYVSGTLDLGGGGSIFCGVGGISPGGTANGQGGGAGGNSGEVPGAVFVYAKTIIGTGTIGSNPLVNGQNGLAGVSPTGTANGNAGTTGGITASVMWAANTTSVNGTSGAAPGATSTGGTGGSAITAAFEKRGSKDYIKILYISGPSTNAIDGKDFRNWTGDTGGSGGGGKSILISNGTPVSGGGGAGGGFVGAGGNGGTGPNDGNHGSNASGGGGGGGGPAGGLTVCVTTSAPSTLTVSAAGGNGGTGGLGFGDGAQGGGGGGGGGGVALLVAPTGTLAVVTAAGGAAGAGGNPGIAGNVGRARFIPLN